MAFSGIKNLFGGKSDASKKEKAFETSEISDDFKFLKIIEMQYLGIPANATPTLTFDRVQGLLALGTMDGNLKIFGKEGIEIMLVGNDTNPVEMLVFLTNKGGLVSYSGLSRYLTLWSLKTLSFDLIPISFRVTKLYYDHGEYLLIGTDQGSLRVLNLNEKRMTCFELKPQSLGVDSEPLVDLLPCPTNPARLVLAFETQGVVVWDLPDHKVTHKITSESPVHVTAWAPDGLSLAIGRRDGSILVYKVEKHAKVQKSFRPDLDSGNLNVSSVSAIYWLESGMLVLGGKAFGTNQQLTFINGLELNESKGIRVPEKFIPMQLLLTPLPESPETFLVMSEDEVLKFSLPDSRLEYINELFGGSEVLTSQFYTISNHGEELDSVIKTLAKIRKTSILNGGVTDDSEVYGMLITGHSEGIVRFWNVGNSRIAHVFNLCLLSGVKSKFQSNTVFFDISETDPCKVSCLELQSFRLFIGFDMGKVGVWEIQEELTLVNVYKYHKVPVLVVKVIHPFVVSGDMDGQVTFFNCETSDVIFEESEIKKTQKLTVTTVEVINRLVYIGYSNGTLQIFNPFSAVFLPSPKLSKVDLKSEVPKRSETGIFKLLFTSLQSQSVILSYERSMFHCNLSDFSVKASQCWTCPMISCNLAHIRSEVYVYVLHADCVISMLDFFSLARLWKSSLPVPLQCFLSRLNFREFHLALDGHFIINTSGKNLIAGWITLHDEDDMARPSLWKEIQETPKPDKKRKSFLGFKFSSEINYSALCKTYAVDRPGNKFRTDDDDDEPPEEIKDLKVESLQRETMTAKNAIQETLQKVSERGDKIKSLEDKMKEMSEKSKNFAMMAAEIAKKEKNKKWWQV